MLKKLMNFGKGGSNGFSVVGAFTSSFKDIVGGMKFANKFLFGGSKKNGSTKGSSNQKNSLRVVSSDKSSTNKGFNSNTNSLRNNNYFKK